MTSRLSLVLILSIAAASPCVAQPKVAPANRPVRLAIAGLVHGHVQRFIRLAASRPEVQLVGLSDPDAELRTATADKTGVSRALLFADLETMLDKAQPDAVATFTSTYDHPAVIAACAKRGIHVMMEKPLAVNMEHARAMEAAAGKDGIQLIVNYETTWYPSTQKAYELIRGQGAIGEIRKIVVHDGHRGPKEIGCSSDFLEWLTDPVLNGSGALNDFGCYGADLMTWLMEGQRPLSVFAMTNHIKPEVYPKVEDEATIVVSYPKAQGIIQASWNWPFDRKDMEVYGRTGYVLAPKAELLRVRKPNENESEMAAPPLSGTSADPLSYLSAVVRGEMKPSGLSSLEVNMMVVEILDAARESARTGKRVELH